MTAVIQPFLMLLELLRKPLLFMEPSIVENETDKDLISPYCAHTFSISQV